MHQTTVRFEADLWEALESECAELGLSVAQYVREAALARLVYAAGKRGDVDRELALVVALEEQVERQRVRPGSE
jgi:predicted nucleotidyltransferase